MAGSALAGTVEVPAPAPAPSSPCGDWCECLANLGTLYKDKSNPYIQEFKVFGRLQVQGAYIDGSDVNDDDFNGTTTEFRRMRLGAQAKFLNGFKLKANVNLEDDQTPEGGDRNFGYNDFDQAKLSYSIKDFGGFDEASITYGRHKIALGYEAHTSSKKIKTVERSGIINKIYDGRHTAVTFDLERGDWTSTFGILSTQTAGDFIGGWNEDLAFYASTEFGVSNGKVLLDFLYNNADDPGDDDESPNIAYQWAASAAWNGNFGNWELLLNAAIGDNGDAYRDERTGLFYGFVVMPSTFILEDKLEFVARWTWQGSEEEEGIRTNSRYFRRDFHDGDVNSGRGDSNNALYAGLNYYFCGNQSKLMTGVEYETLDTPDGDADATTLWVAYRMYF